ncbi:hypothetical protein B566_EDAN010870, partial [Ephemera danica]
ARYHTTCYVLFRILPTEQSCAGKSKAGRPVEKIKQAALQQLIEYLDDNEDCQYSIVELEKIMQKLAGHIDIYSGWYLQNKLQDHYGEDLIVTEITGKCNIITLRTSSHKIIHDHWYSEKCTNANDEKLRIIAAAAAIISEDIMSVYYENDYYTPPSLEQLQNDIPATLQKFLHLILNGKKVRQKINMKIISIAHAIISAMRPRTFLSPLQVASGIWLHKTFASKTVINLFHQLGYCSSYQEVQRFELSATKLETTKISGGFIQHVFDNADINVATLTGHGTFHCLGGIVCVTPASALQIDEKFERVSKIDPAIIVGEINKIAVQICRVVPSSGLRQITVQDINLVHNDINDVHGLRKLCSTTMTLLSSLRYWLKPDSINPSYSGFMQIVTKNQIEYDTSKILFLPFINLSATDPHAIYTALIFAERQCKNLNQSSCFVTFDQPLFVKAMDITTASAKVNELRSVVVRLGGFHLLMAFLGAIGYLMDGSGLQELWCTVYAPNSVTHMLSGKAVARALRAHFLTLAALTSMVASYIDISQETRTNIKLLYEKLMNSHTSSDVDDTEIDELNLIQSKIEQYLSTRGCTHRTTKLWFLYMQLITIIKLFIRAERTGDWELHLYCVRKMIPYFHSCSRLNYAKSAHLYLQNMDNLKSKMSSKDYELFTKMGYFTIRRDNNNFWSGSWTDLIIEQTLMRNISSAGGLSRGRGCSDSVLSKYISSLPMCASYSDAIERLCNIKSSNTEQHMEIGKSRQSNDERHATVFMDWLKCHSPFDVETTALISISNRIIANNDVTCDRAEYVGLQLIQSCIGKNFADLQLKRSEKVLPISVSKNSIRVNDEVIPVDLTQFLNRIICMKLDETDLRACLCYELATHAPSLFDAHGNLRKGEKSALQNSIYQLSGDAAPSNATDQNVAHVIDGGFLLHKIPWHPLTTFGDILNIYVTYVRRHYGIDTTIVFDGYSEMSTKHQTQLQRHVHSRGYEIEFNESTVFTGKKSDFLSITNNKVRFILQLAIKLRIAGFKVIEGKSDADTLIATTAMELAKSRRKDIAIYFCRRDAEKEKLASCGEKFLLALYNSKELSLNDHRYVQFYRSASSSNLSSQLNLANFPPTSDAAKQHSFRVYYQVQQWLGNDMEPTIWGWKLLNNNLVPISSMQPTVPENILHIICCNCKIVCTGRCTCRKNGLFCGPMCGQCRGIDCSNNEPGVYDLNNDDLLDVNSMNPISEQMELTTHGPTTNLHNIDLELFCVHLSKLLQGEGPAVESRAETNATLAGVDLIGEIVHQCLHGDCTYTDFSHGARVITVGGNDDVDVFNNTLEGLEKFLLFQLQLQESTIHLVHEQHRLDTLSDGLTQHSLSLHAHT